MDTHAKDHILDEDEAAVQIESPPICRPPARAPAVTIRRSDVTIPRVSLVIPTLNEAENLKHLLPRIPHWIHEILIVDGQSTDGSPEIAASLRSDVRIILQPRKGKGAALRAGFAAATGDAIVMLDADGSMDPDEILLFIAALMSGADFVKGSRFLQGAGTSDMTYFRRAGNLCLTWAVRALYGSVFSDLCYGYMAFWAKHTPLLESDCDGFEIETLINIRALKNRLKIVEVASFESERVYGTSNLRAIPDGWRVLKTIFREKLGAPVRVPA